MNLLSSICEVEQYAQQLTRHGGKSSVSVVAAWVLLPVNLLARNQPRLALQAFSDNAIGIAPAILCFQVK
jgi:hypothetical protein